MASNPPFQVEDTDEDFFDKLVNDDDDDDYKVAPSSSETTKLADGSDSDDAKAFANLGISDVGSGLEDLGKLGVVEEEACSTLINGDTKHASADTCIDHGHPLVASNSFVFDSVSEEVAANTEVAASLDSTGSWDHGSGGAPGVKEVQWTDFATEAVESEGNGFGSDNDFFTGFGDSCVDEVGKEGNLELVSQEQKVVSGSSTSVVDDDSIMHRKNADQFQDLQTYASGVEQSSSEVQAYGGADGQDPNSSQYWENLYPGWKYDANTGQWYQVSESYDDDAAANLHGLNTTAAASDWAVSNEVSYLQQQQSVQSVVGAVAVAAQEKGMTESVTSWNHVSQASRSNERLSQENNGNGYPSHMVFDPQYPGWYYDMSTQEWCSLDAYNNNNSQPNDQVNQNGYSATSTYYGNDQLNKQSGSEDYDKWNGSFSNVEPQQQGSTTWQPQVNQNGFSATTNTYHGNDQKTYGGQGGHLNLNKQPGSEFFTSQGQGYKWKGSSFEQQGSTMWQPAADTAVSDVRGNQNPHGSRSSFQLDNNQQQSYHYEGAASSFKISDQVNNNNNNSEFPGSQSSFLPGGNFNSQSTFKQSETMNVPKTSYQSGGYLTQHPFHSASSSSTAAGIGRSSAGRPPHALVSFGFGGKLIVMKDVINTSSYGTQDSNGRSISVHNMTEISSDVSKSSGTGVCDYFESLSFPGPLAGGNVGGKELSKWIDERITHSSESSSNSNRDSQVLRLLLSLLKIASQHYGKLRSPFGADPAASKENDAPEVAVARLFASVKKGGAEEYNYGHFTHCLQQLPSERETQATAFEVQSLLVSGKKIEALQCAQEGQLWGPALVLAAQLGDQFYVDTVKKMALRQLVAGSPLRTLCLLIAGQPADAFSTDTTSAVNMSQQGGNCMIEDWEENLAVITANRTKDDELVLIHLGDCLWKERSNIIAAHICYLVAEANIEPYSDTARLCLIGADHWKHPRTYATPEAIQRTEVYEYAKLLGNSQFTLLSFQPYKLIYAHMLAEVGRVSDALKYCQSVSKSLKTGRAPEVELWRQLVSSLEDRIKTHQQGGFSTNLAPGKLVGKLLNLFDSTAHRVVGGLPPPVPSTSGGFGGGTHVDHHQHHGPPPAAAPAAAPRVSTSQSTMAMSSLVPSEPINHQWSDNRKIIHNRSVSEPDFGRSPRQGDTSSKENSADSQSKSSGVASRFGRFGFGSQLFQKTVGLLALKPRGDKQAKLGDTNKFYYDEKLKRWVEEGVDPPAEEAALPPPPTMATFQNQNENGATPEYNLKTALNSQSNGASDFTSPMPMPNSMGGGGGGIPPLPASTTTSNQFSARGRTGVRARYVDTFNQGGGNPTNLFQSPATAAASTIKRSTTPNPKFFVPTAAAAAAAAAERQQEQVVEPSSDNTNMSGPPLKENHVNNNSFQSSMMAKHKFASMDNVSEAATAKFFNHAISPGSRRTASWASFSQQNPSQSPSAHGFGFGVPPNPIQSSSMMDDELQEVDL